ncbi:hypothetical protein ACFL35_02915 [Candidatus Riflebacteria bacterium]
MLKFFLSFTLQFFLFSTQQIELSGQSYLDQKLSTAIIYFKKKNIAAARKVIKQIKQHNPQHSGTLRLEQEILQFRDQYFYEQKRKYQAALANGKHDDALKHINLFLKAYPGDSAGLALKKKTEENYERAVKLQVRGISAKAYNSEGEIVKRVPTEDEIKAEQLFMQGRALFTRHRYEVAFKLFKRAVALAPNNPSYSQYLDDTKKELELRKLLEQIRLYRRTAKKEEVLKRISLLLYRNPGNFRYRFERAQIYMFFNDNQKAFKDFLYIQKQEKAVLESKRKNSIKDYQELLPLCNFYIAICRGRLGELDAAWDQLWNLDPSASPELSRFGIWVELSRVYVRKYYIHTYAALIFVFLGLSCLSFPCYEMGKVQQEFPLQSINNLFNIYKLLQDKRFEEAEIALAPMARGPFSNNLEITYLYALSLAHQKKKDKQDKAERQFQRCLAQNSQFARAHLFAALFSNELTGKPFFRQMKRAYVARVKELPTLFWWLFPVELESTLIEQRRKSIKGELENRYIDLAIATIGAVARNKNN